MWQRSRDAARVVSRPAAGTPCSDPYTSTLARLLDVLWLAALAVYVVAGYRSVPFHGDESTLIAMSRDYHTLVRQRDFAAVRYDPAPSDPAAQELRILNGTVGKMAMGLAWTSRASTCRTSTRPGCGTGRSIRTGRSATCPASGCCVARLSSALLAALSVAFVFGIARIVSGSRAAAWAASLLYALDPAVLLNGRRAMMEGRCSRSARWRSWRRSGSHANRRAARPPGGCGWLPRRSASGGLAIASKHPGAIAVMAVSWRSHWSRRSGARRGPACRTATCRLAWASVLVLLVFLLLNPAWWSDPLDMPPRVVEARQNLMRIRWAVPRAGRRDARRMAVGPRLFLRAAVL